MTTALERLSQYPEWKTKPPIVECVCNQLAVMWADGTPADIIADAQAEIVAKLSDQLINERNVALAHNIAMRHWRKGVSIGKVPRTRK